MAPGNDVLTVIDEQHPPLTEEDLERALKLLREPVSKHYPGGADHDQKSHGNWALGRSGPPVPGEDFTEARPGSSAVWAHPINHGPGPVMTVSQAQAWASGSALQGPFYHGGTRPAGALIEHGSTGMDIFGRGYYVTRSLDAANDYGTITKEVYVNVDKVLVVNSPEWDALKSSEEYQAALGEVAGDSAAALQVVAQRQGYQAYGNGKSTYAVWDATRVAVVREDMRLAKAAPDLGDVHMPTVAGYGPRRRPKVKGISFGRRKRRR